MKFNSLEFFGASTSIFSVWATSTLLYYFFQEDEGFLTFLFTILWFTSAISFLVLLIQRMIIRSKNG